MVTREKSHLLKYVERVIDTDKFIFLSLPAQAVFFHLVSRADEGYQVKSLEKVMSVIGLDVGAFQELVNADFCQVDANGCVSFPGLKTFED